MARALYQPLGVNPQRFLAAGWYAAEDILNPAKLGADGEPELIVAKGKRITPEHDDTMYNVGLDWIRVIRHPT